MTPVKPRLKIGTDGRIELLSEGVRSWSAHQAGHFLRHQYGSWQAFAARFGLHYSHLCEALRGDSPVLVRRAGPVGEIRQLLGLRSEPSAASARRSAAFYRSRGIVAPASIRRIQLQEGRR